MLQSNENSMKIMSPKESSICNTSKIFDVTQNNYKYTNNYVKSTGEILKQNKLTNSMRESITNSTNRLSTTNKSNSPETSFVHKIPNEKCKKRSQYHESLERIPKDETSINDRYKNVSKCDKLQYEATYQKHYFFKSLFMNDQPRDTRLDITKKELKNQLKQLIRNRKLNSLVNRRSGSVCDIVHEIKHEIGFTKSDNSSLDLKLKKSSTVTSNQIQNGHCNYPSCPKVILAPLQFCYQHYFISKFSQDIPSTFNLIVKDVRKRDNFETAENYLNKKSKSNNNITSKNFNKRKSKSDINIESKNSLEFLINHSKEINSNLQNEKKLSNNYEILRKNQLINYTEETDINSILNHVPIQNYDFLTSENVTDNEYDSIHGKLSIIDLNPTVIQIDDKSHESDFVFEKFFEEADKTETLSSSSYNGDFYSNNFHHSEKSFFYCDMNSSVATLLDM